MERRENVKGMKREKWREAGRKRRKKGREEARKVRVFLCNVYEVNGYG